MRSDMNRIVVTSGPTHVDTDALIMACTRLRESEESLSALIASTRSAQDHARLGIGLSPTAYTAVSAIEEVASLMTYLRAKLSAFADSIAYCAAIYSGADSRAVALLSSTHNDSPIFNLNLSQPNLKEPAPGFPMIAQWLRENTWDVRSRNLDVLSAILAFMFGRSDGLTALRFERDLDAFSFGVLHPFGARRGVPGSSTKQVAGYAASWSSGIGALFFGNVTGVEIQTGSSPGAGRGHRIITAVKEGFAPILAASPHTPFALSVLSIVGGVGQGAGAIRSHPTQRVLTPSTPSIQPAMSTPTPISTVDTPLKPSQLLESLSGLKSGGEEGQIKIIRHTTPIPSDASSLGGSRKRSSWSVVIRGTQKWSVGGTNPQDMLTNFEGVAGRESDQSRAVLEAMKMAGIKADEPVEFVGHSQGGIIAAQLATSSDVNQKYNVVSALTAGSPIGGSQAPSHVHVLALENTRDLVPALDGGAISQGVTTVHFDGQTYIPAEKQGQNLVAHDIETYRNLLGDIENRQNEPGLTKVKEWEEHRIESLGLTEQTTSQAYVFDTRRIHD